MAWSDAVVNIEALVAALEKVEADTAEKSVLALKEAPATIRALGEASMRLRDLAQKAEDERELTAEEELARKWDAIKSAPDVETTLAKDVDAVTTAITMSSKALGYSVTRDKATSVLTTAAVAADVG